MTHPTSGLKTRPPDPVLMLPMGRRKLRGMALCALIACCPRSARGADIAFIPHKVHEAFSSTGADADATGEARLHRGRLGTRFEVRLKDLPVGTYTLLRCDGGPHGGGLQGSSGGGQGQPACRRGDGPLAVTDIEVRADDRRPEETEGRVKFDSRSPRRKTLLLTFDPLCEGLAVIQTVGSVTTAFLQIDRLGASTGACGS